MINYEVYISSMINGNTNKFEIASKQKYNICFVLYFVGSKINLNLKNSMSVYKNIMIG